MFVRRRLSLTACLLLLATILSLVACRDRQIRFSIDEQGVITCSDACARHGQCGVMLGDQKAVLANQGGPAVSLHDRFFNEGTVVTVVDLRERELIAARDSVPLIAQSTPFPHIFYQVNTVDKTAWVSEWCLARP
jgi:hypothetical protein